MNDGDPRGILRQDSRARLLDDLARERGIRKTLEHRFLQIGSERLGTDVCNALAILIVPFQKFFDCTAKRRNQLFRVKGLEISRGRIDVLRLVGGHAEPAREELVHGILAAVLVRKDLAPCDTARQDRIRCGTAGVGNEDHVRDATGAREVLAAREIHRLLRVVGGT